MSRKYAFAFTLTAALMLPGCDSLTSLMPGEETSEDGALSEADVGLDANPELTASEFAEGGNEAGVTPMAERVATIGLLNKRNNVSQDLELRPGEAFEEGPVIVRLDACERTAPYEFPQETGAFVQLDVLERGQEEHARVFSGWLFKENPSLNVVEHAIYDVWVKDCAMRFPGEDVPAPAPAASEE